MHLKLNVMNVKMKTITQMNEEYLKTKRPIKVKKGKQVGYEEKEE